MSARPPHGGMFSRHRPPYSVAVVPPVAPLSVWLASRRLQGLPVGGPPPSSVPENLEPSRYGPHDDATAPDSVVYLGRHKWPHPEVRPLSEAVRRQRRELNNRAAGR